MAFNESMEMDISSPLPHKQRFSAQVEVLSPTEISPLDETSMTESELLAPSPPILESARSSTSSVSSVVEYVHRDRALGPTVWLLLHMTWARIRADL